jgi:hypothetical protein
MYNFFRWGVESSCKYDHYCTLSLHPRRAFNVAQFVYVLVKAVCFLQYFRPFRLFQALYYRAFPISLRFSSFFYVPKQAFYLIIEKFKGLEASNTLQIKGR